MKSAYSGALSDILSDLRFKEASAKLGWVPGGLNSAVEAADPSIHPGTANQAAVLEQHHADV
jgi:hypothetical protein